MKTIKRMMDPSEGVEEGRGREGGKDEEPRKLTEELGKVIDLKQGDKKRVT